MLGGGLVILVATTSIDWFYPTLGYMVIAYTGWQVFLSPAEDD
jgi:hypothetical protein